MNDVHKIVQTGYNKIASKYYQRYGKYSPFFLKFSKEFIKLLPKKAKILDLGCGAGRDAKYFSEKGHDVIAVDFSSEMLKIAKKIAPKAKFFQQDFLKLDFSENSFDGIWCSFALLHLKRNEVPNFLKTLNKLLKNGGILFLATKEGEGEIIEKEHLDESLLMYETFFEKDELEEMIKANAFRIILTDLGYDRYESDKKIIVILARKILVEGK